MFNYSGILFIIMLSAAVFLLSYGKGMAGYEKDMIEFVSPSELGATQDLPAHQKEMPVCDHTSKACEHHKPVDLTSGAPAIIEKQVVAADEFKVASYKLGSGDKIKITIFEEKDLSDTYLVNEEGFISMPLVGDVKVKGLTIQDVKKEVEARLANGYLIDPSVAIEVASFRPIYVMGEVNSPGQYSFVTDMTVRNAVAIAGGFTYRANQKSVRILRELNKHSVYRIEGVEPDMKIEPGDTVLIKERFF